MNVAMKLQFDSGFKAMKRLISTDTSGIKCEPRGLPPALNAPARPGCGVTDRRPARTGRAFQKQLAHRLKTSQQQISRRSHLVRRPLACHLAPCCRSCAASPESFSIRRQRHRQARGRSRRSVSSNAHPPKDDETGQHIRILSTRCIRKSACPSQG